MPAESVPIVPVVLAPEVSVIDGIVEVVSIIMVVSEFIRESESDPSDPFLLELQETAKAIAATAIAHFRCLVFIGDLFSSIILTLKF